MAPTPSTEQNFRANLSQFRWARGVTDDSPQAQAQAQQPSSFSRFYNAVAGDYIPLRSSERSNEEEAWFALSRWDSVGSLLVMVGFSVLIGPVNHVKHLLSKERLPFSVVYLTSLALTLYFSLGAQSYIGSLLAGIIQ
ncbi:hypothetical protein ID866_7265, partial [Astraeus odoratus]